ncbi:hypothetical protein SK128_000007, partial [Halocaridina rubra]
MSHLFHLQDIEFIKACSICSLDFGEGEHLPRCLPCAHTICSTCIQSLIDRNQKWCPFCRKHFEANSPRDLGVNVSLFDALQLLKNVKDEKSFGEKPAILDELKENTNAAGHELIKKYQQAEKNITIMLKKQNKQTAFLQELQTKSDETLKLLNKMKGITAHKLNNLQESSGILENQKLALTEKIKHIENVTQKLREAKTFKLTNPHFDELMDYIAMGEKFLPSLRSLMQGYEEIYKETEKDAYSTEKLVVAFKMSLEGAISKSKTIDSFRDTTIFKEFDILQTAMTIKALRKGSGYMIKLIKRGKLFAVQCNSDRRRYAKLSATSGDRICLHRLTDEPIPSDAHLLE